MWAGDASDLDPELAANAPHRTSYRGLETLIVYLQARRGLLFDRFSSCGGSRSAAGTWDALDRAMTDRLDVARERRRAAKRAERARESSRRRRRRSARPRREPPRRRPSSRPPGGRRGGTPPAPRGRLGAGRAGLAEVGPLIGRPRLAAAVAVGVASAQLSPRRPRAAHTFTVRREPAIRTSLGRETAATTSPTTDSPCATRRHAIGFRAVATIRATTTEGLSRFDLDLRGLHVSSVAGRGGGCRLSQSVARS